MLTNLMTTLGFKSKPKPTVTDPSTVRTKQDAYEVIRKHFLTQKERATLKPNGTTCAYRGAGGTKCAVGILIADEYYRSGMEGQNLYTSYIREAVEKSTGLNLSDKISDDSTFRFLIDAQRIHDDTFEGTLADRVPNLDALAARHGLEVK